MNIPSYQVKKGDIVGVREKSKTLNIIQETRLKNESSFEWLSWNQDELKGTLVSIPERIQRCLSSGCDVALHSHGELADLERAIEGLQPINDLSWGRWESSLEWVKERTIL